MKIKKVLFLAPPAVTLKSGRDINPLPPMGLGYLAAVLRDMDIEVKILDCLMRGWEIETEADDLLIRVGLPEKEIEEQIKEFDPDLIGVSCQFSRQYKIYHRMFTLAKKAKKECVTIGGGAHVTVCPQEVLEDPACDFILSGEAEASFKDFVIKLSQGLDVSSVDGLGWKRDGKMHLNNKRGWINNLDSIPFPAYDIMELDRYFGLEASHGLRHKERFCPIITSRGCTARCTFCSAARVWGNKYRVRSVENVLQEMRILKDRYNIQELMFEDDNVTANATRAKELFSKMAKERFDFTWDTPNGVGVWGMDEEMLDLIKGSGCIKLNFPVESGSQMILDTVIKKPLKLNRVKALIEYCRKIKLDYGMFLIIGLPGEKKEDIWKTFKFAASCKVFKPHFSIATPYPGTLLFEQCKNDSLFSREFSFDDLFIRSYLIKTKDWDGSDLKRILKRGSFYLIINKLIYDPLGFARLALRKAKRTFKKILNLRKKK